MSYASWYVGMKVVCVDPQDDPEPPNPIYGNVYTVSWIGLDKYNNYVLVDLLELPAVKVAYEPNKIARLPQWISAA